MRHPPATAPPDPAVAGFHDAATGTVSYVVADTEARCCAIIDPVLDYDPHAARTRTEAADRLVEFVRSRGLTLLWIFETHAHADHLSAAQYLKAALGGKVVIGERIREVQTRLGALFNLGDDFATDGSQFDRLVLDHEQLALGGLDVEVMATPGHTPACVSYRIGDAVFVGDTLFMPDAGTARADFPGGDARQLYRSIRRLLSLPRTTRLFVCHDYRPAGRDAAWQTTVDAQRRSNVHIRDEIAEDVFVSRREARDRELEAPRLLWPALQVNIRAGHPPEPEANGCSYLKIPLNALG